MIKFWWASKSNGNSLHCFEAPGTFPDQQFEGWHSTLVAGTSPSSLRKNFPNSVQTGLELTNLAQGGLELMNICQAQGRAPGYIYFLF